MTDVADRLGAALADLSLDHPDTALSLKIDKQAYGLSLAGGTLTLSEAVPDSFDLAMTLTSAVAAAWADGDVDLVVAYMRGDAKIEGEPGPVIEFVKAVALAASS